MTHDMGAGAMDQSMGGGTVPFKPPRPNEEIPHVHGPVGDEQLSNWRVVEDRKFGPDVLNLQPDPRARAYAALARAQGAYLPLRKTRTAKMVKEGRLLYEYNYADLADVFASVRQALSDSGFSITQKITQTDKALTVTTQLRHESGHVIESSGLTMPLPPLSKPQEIASVISYARRYDASALLGVASEVDSDAVRIGQSENGPSRRRAAAPAPEDTDPADENQDANATGIVNFATVHGDLVLALNNCRSLPELQTVFATAQKSLRKSATANQIANELAVAAMGQLVAAKDKRKHAIENPEPPATGAPKIPKIDTADLPGAGALDNDSETFGP